MKKIILLLIAFTLIGCSKSEEIKEPSEGEPKPARVIPLKEMPKTCSDGVCGEGETPENCPIDC